MEEQIEKYIDELRHTITVAGLNYDIWWVYKEKDTRSRYLEVMNHYSLFFQTGIHAHFVATLVALYTLYETRKDTYHIPGLLRLLKKHSSFSTETLKALEEHYARAKPLWVKVQILRNNAFGHNSRNTTTEETFKIANVKPDEFKELMEITKELLNDLTHEWDQSVHAFNLGSRDSTIRLLEDLCEFKKRL